MNFIFCETSYFSRRIAELLDDETYRQLQAELLENPVKGEVIPGCGGMRKLRLEAHKRGKGKRGGFRAIYLHVPNVRWIYFVTIYGKDEQDDLDSNQKKQLRTIAEQAREALMKRQRVSKG